MNDMTITGVQRGYNWGITRIVICVKTRITRIVLKSFSFYVLSIYIPELLGTIESRAIPVIPVITVKNEPRCILVIFYFPSVTTSLFNYKKCKYKERRSMNIHSLCTVAMGEGIILGIFSFEFLLYTVVMTVNKLSIKLEGKKSMVVI